MAKEMMIVFVYDTQLLQREEDDPASAVLYFHPNWVSDQQKTALCGQIMGTYNFLKTTFAVPKIVSLQSGKFAMKEYGRYTIAIGTDRNIPDWILEHRKDIMDSLITFYHKDLPTLATVYENRDSLCAKLYLMFENYLRVLIYSGSGFSNIPMIQLPKSASSVFLESLQILQHCQEIEFVLGGIMLYHNMVLSTQLSTSVTQRFVLTDPYRIKSPAELVSVPFDLPQGVQLLQVYLDEQDFDNLKEESARCRGLYDRSHRNKVSSRPYQSQPKEQVLSAIKREQSIIFTTVPEEDTSPHSPNLKATYVHQTPAKKSRPKFLNLRSNTIDLCCNSIPDKIIPSTPFKGQTSVCSTPMTELNKVLHQSVLNICLNPENDDNNDSGKNNSVNSAEFSLLAKFHAKPYFPLDRTYLATLRRCASSTNINGHNLQVTRRHSVADASFHAVKSDNKLISKILYRQYYDEQTKIINNFDSTNAKPININHVKTEEASTSYATQTTSKQTADRSATAQRRKSLNLPLKSLSFDASVKPKQTTGVLLTPLMSKLSLLADDRSSSGFSSRTSTPSPINEDEQVRTRENIISRGLIVPSSEIAEDIEDAARRNNNNRDVRVPSREVSVEREDVILRERSDEDRAEIDLNVKYRGVVRKKGCEILEGGMQRAVLFVCGQEDMVVGMLLEEEGVKNDGVVKKLHEVCLDHLIHLEKTLVHTLSTHPNNHTTPLNRKLHHNHQQFAQQQQQQQQQQHRNCNSGSEPPYSYLSVDKVQCTVQRAGGWAGEGYGIVTHLHRDFMRRGEEEGALTEIVLR